MENLISRLWGRGVHMTRKLPRRLVLGMADIVVVILAVGISFIIRFDGNVPTNYASELPTAVWLFVGIRMAVYYIAGFYRSLWRYAGIRRVVTILWATA